jgi:hypothetical protein
MNFQTHSQVFYTSKLGQPSGICIHASKQSRQSGLSAFLFYRALLEKPSFPFISAFLIEISDFA